MPASTRKQVSQKYCQRFGQTAVEMGYISEAQLQDALCRQVHEELAGEGHRLLGTILFDLEWMSWAQIDTVMTRLLRSMRREPA